MDYVQALSTEKIGTNLFEIKVRFDTYEIANCYGRDMVDPLNSSLIDDMMSTVDDGNTENIEKVSIEKRDRDLYDIIVRVNTQKFTEQNTTDIFDRVFKLSMNSLTITKKHVTRFVNYHRAQGNRNQEMRNRHC